MLVEIHDEAELEVALGVGATMVGVNQRDLVTFEVDHERAVRMAAAIPDGVVKVAETGVRDRDDARRLADAGYDAILVGETLVTRRRPAPKPCADSSCPEHAEGIDAASGGFLQRPHCTRSLGCTERRPEGGAVDIYPDASESSAVIRVWEGGFLDL